MDACPYCGKECKVLALHLRGCKAKKAQEQSDPTGEEVLMPNEEVPMLDIEQLMGLISEKISGEVAKQTKEVSQSLASQMSSQVQANFSELAKQINTNIESRMKAEADRLSSIAEENLNQRLAGKMAGNPAQAGNPVGGHSGWLDNPGIQNILASMAARSMGIGGSGTFTDELSKYKTLQDILIKPQMDSFTQGMSLMINIFGTAMKGGATREELGGTTGDMLKAVDKGREGMGLVK